MTKPQLPNLQKKLLPTQSSSPTLAAQLFGDWQAGRCSAQCAVLVGGRHMWSLTHHKLSTLWKGIEGRFKEQNILLEKHATTDHVKLNFFLLLMMVSAW